MKWLRDGDKIKREGEEGWRSWKLEVNEDLKKGKAGGHSNEVSKEGHKREPDKEHLYSWVCARGSCDLFWVVTVPNEWKKNIKRKRIPKFSTLSHTLNTQLNSVIEKVKWAVSHGARALPCSGHLPVSATHASLLSPTSTPLVFQHSGLCGQTMSTFHITPSYPLFYTCLVSLLFSRHVGLQNFKFASFHPWTCINLFCKKSYSCVIK